MSRYIQKLKSDIGLSPDYVEASESNNSNTTELSIVSFNKTALQEANPPTVEALKNSVQRDTINWITVKANSIKDIYKDIGQQFELDPLALAAVSDHDGRPTVQEYEACLFLSCYVLFENPEKGVYFYEKVSFILKKNLLFTFVQGKKDWFEPVRSRIRTGKPRIRSGEIDYLLYTLLDVVVDHCMLAISELGDKIESIDEILTDSPDPSVVKMINRYKKEVHFIRKAIKPSKELLEQVLKFESEYMHEGQEVHLRDLKNNVIHILELAENYREMLSDQMHMYHTLLSSKLNDIMKFLTIFSVIFIPLTFIAGIYGTNFDVLPELHDPNGYYYMWTTMVAIACGMMLYFKKRKWF